MWDSSEIGETRSRKASKKCISISQWMKWMSEYANDRKSGEWSWMWELLQRFSQYGWVIWNHLDQNKRIKSMWSNPNILRRGKLKTSDSKAETENRGRRNIWREIGTDRKLCLAFCLLCIWFWVFGRTTR